MGGGGRGGVYGYSSKLKLDAIFSFESFALNEVQAQTFRRELFV